MIKNHMDVKGQISSLFDVSLFSTRFDVLTKLRIIVGLITLFSTLSIVLVFFIDFFYSAMMILLSYFLVLILCVKLFVIRHL